MQLEYILLKLFHEDLEYPGIFIYGTKHNDDIGWTHKYGYFAGNEIV